MWRSVRATLFFIPFLLAALRAGSAPPPPAASLPAEAAMLVFQSGQRMVVQCYSLEGDLVHLVDAAGEPRVVRASLVDIRASEEATLVLREGQVERNAAARSAGPATIAAARPGLPEAAASGGSQDKPTLLFFTARWCGWCRKMQGDTLADATVKQALAAWDLRVVDVDAEEKLAGKHAVRGVPAYVALDRRGKAVKRGSGYIPPAAFLDWLGKN